MATILLHNNETTPGQSKDHTHKLIILFAFRLINVAQIHA